MPFKPARLLILTAHRRMVMPRMIAALLASGLSTFGYTHGLMDYYRVAVDNDPKFQSARFGKIAGEESEAIGRAGLLPSVSFSYSRGKNNADRTITYPSGSQQVDKPQYDNEATTLSVRQPLLNFEAWQRYKGGRSQVNFSNAKFSADEQDLIVRLTTAYLDVLMSENQLRLSIAQRRAYEENQLLNQQLFQKGAGTRTDVLETRARFELAEALVAESQDNVANRRNEFAVIIGRDPGAIDDLIESLPLLPVVPAAVADWEQLAREHNPDLRAQRHSIEYARTEVERNRAGHYPRVDLVASHSRNTADSLLTYNQESTVNSVGVQLSVPLYSGGGINAQTRQAAARLAGSYADLDAAGHKVLVEIRKQFQLVNSTRKRISAMEQAERSAAEAVEATRKSVIGGQRVNVDVLNALQQLYTTRRDLSEARHGYLLAYLRLHAAAGLLDSESLGKIAACFKPDP
jgi:protease secretion system outer membrane protein